MTASPGSWATRSGGALAASASIIVFAVIAYSFRDRGVLAEWDLYSVLLGLLDGAVNGTWLNSPLHYDRSFGFGYIAAIYSFVDTSVLKNPDQLMTLINSLGLAFFLPGLVLFWINVRTIHGSLIATIALILFAFSPMTLELATSGHPIQIAFAFLMAGTSCMLWPLQGWRAVLAMATALVLLTMGLIVRAEIFLAFPWLVLAKASQRSFPVFIRSCCVRSLPPAGALIAVFILKALFVADVPGSVTPSISQYFSQFYTWDNLQPGVIYAALGCGLATSAVALFVLIWAGWSAVFRKMAVGELLAPIALVIVPAAFFLPNPLPPRHFLLSLAGLGILIGWAATRVARPNLMIWATVVLVLANQALAEAVRPVVLRINQAHSPYMPPAATFSTTTHANVGWNWERHAALVRRRLAREDFMNNLLTATDANLAIVSDEPPQIFARLFRGNTDVHFNTRTIGQNSFTEATFGTRHVIVIEEAYVWPGDPVSLVLNDPTLADYKIVLDPVLMSVYSKTPIPTDRAAKLTPKRHGAKRATS